MSRVEPGLHPAWDESMEDVTRAHPRRALPPNEPVTGQSATEDSDQSGASASSADDTAPRPANPRRAEPEPPPAGSDDLTAVRSDIGVYDPTVPRTAFLAKHGDDTLAVTDDTLPASALGLGSAESDSDATAGPARTTPDRVPPSHALGGPTGQQLPAVMPPADPGAGTPTTSSASEATWFVPDDDPLGTLSGPPQTPAQPATEDEALQLRQPAQPAPAAEPRRFKRPGPFKRRDGASVDRTSPAPASGAGEPARTALTWMREIAIVVVIAMICTTLVRSFVLQPFAVPSGSMENTLQISDKIVVSKAMGFTRGDVVVFSDDLGWLPEDPQAPSGPVRGALEFLGVLPDSGEGHLVKRVIGMPGDIVSCCDAAGNLIVNGKSLDESAYLYPASQQGQPPVASESEFRVTVPADRVFVLGDHREDSADARCHLAPDPNEAFVSTDSILGPVNMIVAPMSRWTYLSPPPVFESVPDPPGPAPPNPLVTAEAGC